MLGLDRVVLSTPDQSSPTSSIYHHSIATKLVAILDRKVEQLGLLVIPLHQRHRVGGCEKGKSQSYSNCHLPNVITFQLSSAPRPFSSGTDQRSVRHHVTESSQRRWKEFRFCPWHGALWLPIAAGRDYLRSRLARMVWSGLKNRSSSWR